jgi:hypothetical protein
MTTAADVDAQERNASPALLVASARELLSRYAPFRGRLDGLQFEAQPDSLTVRGTVPTFYLRHLLQAALRQLPMPVQVVNRVEVICPQGISGCSPTTRARCALEFKILGKVPTCFPTCPGTPGSTGDEE